MIAKIILHQCDHGRATRDSIVMPKFRDYLRHLAPMCQNRGKSPGYYTKQTAHLEKGAKHATITASIKPIWGISVKRLEFPCKVIPSRTNMAAALVMAAFSQ